MGEFPSKMEHTQKKVEVLKPQNKVLMWFLSEVALLEKGWTVTEGFNSVSKWMEKSLLPFSLEKKNAGDFTGFCFEEAWKKANFGKKMFWST